MRSKASFTQIYPAKNLGAHNFCRTFDAKQNKIDIITKKQYGPD